MSPLRWDSFWPSTNRAQGDGPVWLLFLFLTIWLGDTAAYYVGSLLGKRPLAPRISPRKTWEGAIGALLGNSLAALMGQVLIPQTPLIPRFLPLLVPGDSRPGRRFGRVGDQAGRPNQGIG